MKIQNYYYYLLITIFVMFLFSVCFFFNSTMIINIGNSNEINQIMLYLYGVEEIYIKSLYYFFNTKYNILTYTAFGIHFHNVEDLIYCYHSFYYLYLTKRLI